MPIQSYLVYTTTEKKEKLVEKLNFIKNCKATPSTNEDILILITDTKDQEEETELQEKFKNTPELTNMALVFARENEK